MLLKRVVLQSGSVARYYLRTAAQPQRPAAGSSRRPLTSRWYPGAWVCACGRRGRGPRTLSSGPGRAGPACTALRVADTDGTRARSLCLRRKRDAEN